MVYRIIFALYFIGVSIIYYYNPKLGGQFFILPNSLLEIKILTYGTALLGLLLLFIPLEKIK